MPNFEALANSLKSMGYIPMEIHKETADQRITYEYFDVSFDDKDQLSNVAKKIDKSLAQTAGVKILDTLSSISPLKTWSVDNLASFAQAKLEALFPSQEERNPLNPNEYYRHVLDRTHQIKGIALERLSGKTALKKAGPDLDGLVNQSKTTKTVSSRRLRRKRTVQPASKKLDRIQRGKELDAILKL